MQHNAFDAIKVNEKNYCAANQLQNRYIDAEHLAHAGLRLAELEAGGFAGHALMPYSTKLKDFGAWFVQLWGESLGKERPRREPVGTIPVAAVGATDQHSLLQLLVEGPNRIITGFVRIEEWPKATARATAMAKLPAEFAGLSYAFGKPFCQILNAEETATKTVLIKRGRPVYELSLTNPGAQAIGALMALYMDLVVYTAASLEADPFDQPGVELGKKIVPELLSQP
jgi:glucose-6-phosphate isomerase